MCRPTMSRSTRRRNARRHRGRGNFNQTIQVQEWPINGRQRRCLRSKGLNKIRKKGNLLTTFVSIIGLFCRLRGLSLSANLMTSLLGRGPHHQDTTVHPSTSTCLPVQRGCLPATGVDQSMNDVTVVCRRHLTLLTGRQMEMRKFEGAR